MIWTWQTDVETASLLRPSGAFYANDHHGRHSHTPTLPRLQLLVRKILRKRAHSTDTGLAGSVPSPQLSPRWVEGLEKRCFTCF